MKIINREYTKYNQEHASWKNGLFAALVVVLFFLLFQPFGFRDKDLGLKALLFPGYALIAFLYTQSTFFVVRKILKTKKIWTLKNEILSLFISMFPLVFIVHVYSYWATGDMPLNIYWFFKLFYHISCLALLVSIIEFFYYSNLTADSRIEYLSSRIHHYSKQIADPEQENTRQSITIVLEKGSFTVNREKLVYIESQGNYLSFIFYEKDGETKKLMKRGRLHQAETNLKDFPEYFRCHRGFIVNLKKAKQIKGNNKNARLILDENLGEIPVSRTHFKTLTEKLDEIIAS